MKIKSLQIDSYRHLGNIHFDFTYPEGHENAGEPLKKICIIGQSATGKTGILELIKDNFAKLKLIETLNDTWLFNHYEFIFKGGFEFISKKDLLYIDSTSVIKNGKIYSFNEVSNGPIDKLIKDDRKLIYISSEIISKETTHLFNQNPQDILNDRSLDQRNGFEKTSNFSNYVIEFNQISEQEIWFSLLFKILDYRKKFTQMASELINKGAIGDINILNRQYSKWAESNVNPLVTFANFFNPILNKLNLEVDLINTEYLIPIKSKITGEVIPVSGLSTGTKGLLLTMFPLFELNTKDGIILLDEPERSLFPDMQIDLITHYQHLAPDAQFVVATHSPFIAAAFEPEERFILYFDEKGKVAVRRGESPIGDDPNDILRNDFKIDYYNEFGKKAYQQYLDLKRKVSQETEAEKKRELIVELAELGDKYNF